MQLPDEKNFTLTLVPPADGSYYGIYFTGPQDKFWIITCPCGVAANFGINDLPKVNTLHPCGKPDHWTVFYEEANEAA